MRVAKGLGCLRYFGVLFYLRLLRFYVIDKYLVCVIVNTLSIMRVDTNPVHRNCSKRPEFEVPIFEISRVVGGLSGSREAMRLRERRRVVAARKALAGHQLLGVGETQMAFAQLKSYHSLGLTTIIFERTHTSKRTSLLVYKKDVVIIAPEEWGEMGGPSLWPLMILLSKSLFFDNE